MRGKGLGRFYQRTPFKLMGKEGMRWQGMREKKRRIYFLIPYFLKWAPGWLFKMFVERRSSYWKEGAQSRELFIEVSVNYNFILSKSFIRKRKLQHYLHEPKVNIYVFHLLNQLLIIKRTILPQCTLHTCIGMHVYENDYWLSIVIIIIKVNIDSLISKLEIETGFPRIPTILRKWGERGGGACSKGRLVWS